MKTIPKEIAERITWSKPTATYPMEPVQIEKIKPIEQECDICSLITDEHRRHIQYDPHTGVKFMRCMGCRRVWDPTTGAMSLGYQTKPNFVYDLVKADK